MSLVDKGSSVKKIMLTLTTLLLSACATHEEVQNDSSQKITITGTRIKSTDIPPGPKLKISPIEINGNRDFMRALAGSKLLPQPMVIGDCLGLLNALNERKIEYKILDTDTVILENENGKYTYSFDDASCPTDET